MKNKAVVIAIIASIGFFLAAIAVGIAYYMSKKPQKTVSVVGLVEKDFTSDLIVWEFDYATKDMDMKQSYAKLKAQNEIVKAYLKNAGIPDKEVDFKKITTRPTYNSYYSNGHWVEDFDGYEASQDAKNRAETITKNAGAKLGDLKSANMGVFQITKPNSSEEDYTWGGAFNTSSKEKRASINMRLTYYVK